MFSLVLHLLRFLPKNLLSAVFGRFAALELPAVLNVSLLTWYAKRYRVNLEEAEKPLNEYPSLLKFFTRNLRSGIRPIGEGVVSPVDGRISELGPIRNGELVQAKGIFYSLDQLLGSADLAARYREGYFLTIYLAPGDYHHIHSPVDGDIGEFVALPGTLWPVNEGSVCQIPKLFCENERLISFVESRDFGTVAVVKVGATNVGSIRLTYDSFVTNRSPATRTFSALWSKVLGRKVPPGPGVFHQVYREKKEVKKGERIATFELGSTVILLFEAGKFSPHADCRRGVIRLGNQLSL